MNIRLRLDSTSLNIQNVASIRESTKTILNLTLSHLTVRTLLLIVCLWTYTASAQISLFIEGVDDNAIEEQLDAYLVIPDSAQFVFESNVDGEDVDITMTITPGKPVRVSRLVLDISGVTENNNTFKELEEVKNSHW